MSYKIDKYDLLLLYALDKNARQPETTLAKNIGRSKESVRYRITKLQQANIIKGFSCWIDPVRLGFSCYKLYFCLANKPGRKEAFRDYVLDDKRLFWLGVAEGAWNVGMTFFLQSPREFYTLKNELQSRFSDIILEISACVLVQVNTCNKDFLVGGRSDWLSFFEQKKDQELDDIKRTLLRELHIDSKLTLVDLAQKTKVSVDIVKNKMKTLEKDKVIVKYFAQVDYNNLGYDFFKTFVYINNIADSVKLKEFCRIHPNIVHYVEQVSAWDVELEILCQGFKEYYTILDSLTREFPDMIKKTETAVMYEDHVFPARKFLF